MPLAPQIKVALAAGSTAAIAGIAWWAIERRDERPDQPGKSTGGRLLCPSEVGKESPLGPIEAGDFVVVQLQSADATFSEPTWATVLSVSGDSLFAVLSGEQIEEGVRPLQTKRHGFRLGHRMLIQRDCVWEIFHPSPMTGQILCGPQVDELAKFLEDDDLAVTPGGLIVQPGDRAEIVVGSELSYGNLWHERLWTRILSVSPSGQVITAMIDEDPALKHEHGLVLGSIVRYNRDCVIGV